MNGDEMCECGHPFAAHRRNYHGPKNPDGRHSAQDSCVATVTRRHSGGDDSWPCPCRNFTKAKPLPYGKRPDDMTEPVHPFPELREVLADLVDEVADVMESLHDAVTVGTDRLVRDLGEDGTGILSDLIVTDDERDALDARALGRTLKAIDRLPVA